MKRTYVAWFFFSAGWGYLMSQPFPDAEPRELMHIAAAFPLGALTTFLILGVEAWRASPGKLLAPNIELKPWQMPVGMTQFVFATFMFASFWGLVFAFALASSDFREPLFYLMMSIGGIGGLLGVHRAFPSRFAA